MKTIETIEKKSLLSKIIDAFKNTALYNIFLNENSGLDMSSDEIDPEQQIEYLAQNSDCSKDEIRAIEAAFKTAAKSVEPLQERVYSVPQESKQSENPFKVNATDLNHDILTSQIQTNHDSKGRERDE